MKPSCSKTFQSGSFYDGVIPYSNKLWTIITVEPQYNEPLYNEVFSITNDFVYPSNSKIYGKVPRYKENPFIGNKFCQSLGTSLYRGSIV